MTWIRIAVACTMAVPLVAQAPKAPAPQAATAPAPGPSSSQRVFVLKYADPVQTANVLRAFGARAVVDTEAHAVAVLSAFPDTMAQIDDAIQRLDIPAAAQNIELTGYFVIGAATTPQLGGVLPKDLDSVTAELTKSSGLKNFRLLDGLTIRMRAGLGADTSGTAGPVATGSPLIATDFRVRSATVSADGTAIRVDGLYAGVKMPVLAGGSQYTTSELSLNADVDLKDNQKTVVGRVGMNRDQALFLVMVARIAK
jgi:hypothetical protein